MLFQFLINDEWFNELEHNITDINNIMTGRITHENEITRLKNIFNNNISVFQKTARKYDYSEEYRNCTTTVDALTDRQKTSQQFAIINV